MKNRVRVVATLVSMAMLLGVSLTCLAAPPLFGEPEALAPAEGQSKATNSAVVGGKATVDDPTVIRARQVVTDLGLLAIEDGSPGRRRVAEKLLLLNLFNDASYTAVLDRLEVRSKNSFTWLGYIEGVSRSEVILVVENGVMVGNVRVSGALYQVRYDSGGLHSIREIDLRAFPPEK